MLWVTDSMVAPPISPQKRKTPPETNLRAWVVMLQRLVHTAELVVNTLFCVDCAIRCYISPQTL